MRFLLKLVLIGIIFNLIIIGTLFFLPAKYYKDGLAWVAGKYLGAELDIAGDLKLQPFEQPFIYTTNTTVKVPMENAGSFTLKYASLDINRDGMHVPEVIMKGADIIYIDPIAKANFELNDINIGLYIPTPESPLTIDADAVALGQRVDVDVVIEDPKQLEEGGSTPLTVDANSKFFKANYKGTHSKKQKKGTLVFDVASLYTFLNWIQAGVQDVSGSGIFTADFTANSNKLEDIVANGTVQLRNLVNPDISKGFKQVMAVMVHKGKAQIDSIDASYTLKQGVVRNDDLVGYSPVGKFTGKGMVDLVNKMIDYRIEPDLSKGPVRGLESLTWPVTIRGPIDNPEINLEARDVIEQVIKKDVLKQVLDRDNGEQTLGDAATIILEEKAGIKLDDASKKELQNLRDQLLGDEGKESLNKLFKNN